MRADEQPVRRLAELAASEAGYRALLEDVPVGIGLSTPEGLGLAANTAMCKITGYSVEEFQRIRVVETYHRPADRAELLQRFRRDGFVRSFETQLKRRDGSLYWASLTITPFSLGGEPVFLTVAEDITERVRADEQIRYQAALLANVSDAVIATDMDFCVTSWNQAAEEIYGWQADEALGKPLGALVQAEYPSTSREKVIAEFVEKGKWQGQTIHHHKDGTAIHILGSVSAFEDGAGNRVGAVSVNRDVSERVRAEEEIRQRTEDLALINALNDAGNRGLSLQEIVQLLVQETRRIFDCHGATVYLLSQDGQHLVMQSLTLPAAVTERIERLIGRAIPPIQIPLGEDSLYATLLQAGQPTLVNDAKDIQQFMVEFTKIPQLPNALRPALRLLVPRICQVVGIDSFMNVPLVSEGQVVGMVDISRREPFTEADLKRFATIARQLTAIIQRKRAEEALQEYSERLEEKVEERTRELRRNARAVGPPGKAGRCWANWPAGWATSCAIPLGAIRNAAYFLDMVLQDPEPDVAEMLQILEQEVGTCNRIITSLLDFARPRLPALRAVDLGQLVQKSPEPPVHPGTGGGRDPL